MPPKTIVAPPAPTTAPSDAPRLTSGKIRLPRSLRVQVVRERPQLRDDDHVEDTRPDVERDPDVDACQAEQPEDHEVGREEGRHTANQLEPVDTRRERAVGGDDEQQQHRLACRRIAGDFGAAFAQNQRIANDLEDGVKGQQQKEVESNQQRAGSLAGVHIRKERQQAVEPALVLRISHCPHLSHSDLVSKLTAKPEY